MPACRLNHGAAAGEEPAGRMRREEMFAKTNACKQRSELHHGANRSRSDSKSTHPPNTMASYVSIRMEVRQLGVAFNKLHTVILNPEQSGKR